MSMAMALAIGSAVSGLAGAAGNRRQGKDSAQAAEDAYGQAERYLGKQTGVLDGLKPVIDKFAEQGQGQFDRYNEMVGPLEDSLQNHYMNLDPDMYAAQGNQTAQQQYQNSMDQVNNQLAAQGITNSGASSQMAGMYGNQMAQTKAQNIMNAPEQVAQQQQGWLDYTSGKQSQGWNQMQQGVSAQSGLSNQYTQAYGNMANMYGNRGAESNQNAQNANAQGQQARQSGMMGLGYFGDKAGMFS